VEALDFQ